MKFSRREEQRDDRVLDVVTDEENGVRLIVSRLGAELISIARRDASGGWIGFLYRDNDISIPTQSWANHATVMGYYLHRLKDGHSFYRGQEIKGGTHSFLRLKTWHVVEQESQLSGSLTYRITPEDFSATEYPLKVKLDLTYRLENGTIRVVFRFDNEEPDLTAHVGFGLHPGFGATSFQSFRFVMPAGKYRRHFSPCNYLDGETEDIEFGGGEMPFAREQLPGSYIVELLDLASPQFTFQDPPSGREVTLDFAGVPYLTLWSDGGPFLCVEPCWGLTDHHAQRNFEDKEGIRRIPPKNVLQTEFVMKPQLTPARSLR
jgi:galactose mutarotase-like enzyme